MLDNVVPIKSEPKDIHIMVDLETLGMGVNAIVMSIGAVEFNPYDANSEYTAAFSADIDIATYPGVIDISTLKFWFEQAQKGNHPPIKAAESFQTVFTNFVNWLSAFEPDKNNLIIWANGTDFDIPKLQYMYSVFQMETTWKYNNVRDCRTIFKEFGGPAIEKPENVSKHNALADAIWQAKYLSNILSVYKRPTNVTTR